MSGVARCGGVRGRLGAGRLVAGGGSSRLTVRRAGLLGPGARRVVGPPRSDVRPLRPLLRLLEGALERLRPGPRRRCDCRPYRVLLPAFASAAAVGEDRGGDHRAVLDMHLGDPLHVGAGLGVRRDAVVLAHRTGSGVVGGQRQRHRAERGQVPTSSRAAPSTAWAGFFGSTPSSRAVPGMSCMRPMAPAWLRALASKPDSARATDLSSPPAGRSAGGAAEQRVERAPVTFAGPPARPAAASRRA